MRIAAYENNATWSLVTSAAPLRFIFQRITLCLFPCSAFFFFSFLPPLSTLFSLSLSLSFSLSAFDPTVQLVPYRGEGGEFELRYVHVALSFVTFEHICKVGLSHVRAEPVLQLARGTARAWVDCKKGVINGLIKSDVVDYFFRAWWTECGKSVNETFAQIYARSLGTRLDN